MDPGSLWPVEFSAAAILVFFLALMAARGLASAPPGRASLMWLLSDVVRIAVAAWAAEVLAIRLFGFYQYDAPWALFADVMPLEVALIWPFVILSARELAWHLGAKDARGPKPWAVFAIVLYDASLVEPIAVSAGLWSWNEPGIFGVPPIGILGWGLFAALASAVLDRAPRAMILAPIAVQALLVGAWWGLFRWGFREPADPRILAIASAGLAAVLAALAIRAGKKAPLWVMAPRMAAAILFFVLLFFRGTGLVPLIAYAVPFALPYLALTRLRG